MNQIPGTVGKNFNTDTANNHIESQTANAAFVFHNKNEGKQTNKQINSKNIFCKHSLYDNQIDNYDLSLRTKLTGGDRKINTP